MLQEVGAVKCYNFADHPAKLKPKRIPESLIVVPHRFCVAVKITLLIQYPVTEYQHNIRLVNDVITYPDTGLKPVMDLQGKTGLVVIVQYM
jgi:hypothetical protein